MKIEDTDTVHDLTTYSKEELCQYLKLTKEETLSSNLYRLLPAEVFYIMKLINNDLEVHKHGNV